MYSSLNDYRDVIYNPIIEKNTIAFIDEKEMKSLKDNYTTGTVLQGYEYRPDLIANYYLGDTSLAWIITYINEFQNGIQDYYPGRTIKIPVLS